MTESLNSTKTEKTAKRVAKNSVAQLARFAAIFVSKFLIVVVIARWQGVEQVGDFSFVMTYTLTFSFLNNMGLIVLLMREISQKRDMVHKYVENALTLCLFLGGVSVAAMGVTADLLGYDGQILTAVYLVGVALVLDTLGNLFLSAFSGYERMELGALAIVIQEIAFLVIGVIVLALKLPFLWIFVVYIASRFISLIASGQIYRRLWGKMPRLGFDWDMMKYLSRKTLPFGLNIALSPVFARVDILLLSYMKGNVAVGYYEVASTLFYRLNVLARMINIPILALMANEYPKIGRAVGKYVERLVKYQTVLALPIMTACWIVGDKIILFLYGEAFVPSILAFQVMSLVLLFRFVNHTFGVTLVAINREGRRSVATAVLAFFNIGLNLILIPRYSFMGASISSVATEIGYFILLYIFILSSLRNPIKAQAFVRPIIASLIMGALLFSLHNWSVLILIPLGAVVYGIANLLLRTFSPAEMELFLKVTRMQKIIPAGLRKLIMPMPAVTK